MIFEPICGRVRTLLLGDRLWRIDLNLAVENAIRFIECGKKVIRLNPDSSVPSGKWIPITKDQAENHKGNFGWLLGKTDIVLDIDPRNGGVEGFEKLQADYPALYGYEFSPSVYTPRGGFHIYTTHKDSFSRSDSKTLKKYPGIDFLRDGMYVTMPGCVRPEGVYEYDPFFVGLLGVPELPAGVRKLLKRVKKQSEGRTTLNKVHMALEDVQPEDYETWLKVGMAIHKWDSDAVDIWDEWSRRSEKYEGEDKILEKWESFNDADDGVTIASLFFMANAIRAEKKSAFDDWILFGPSNRYYSLRTKESLSSEGFNTRMASYVPPKETSKGISRPMPTTWAKQIDMVVVSRDEYATDRTESIFTDRNGAIVLNAFDSDTVTKPKASLDQQDIRAFNFFKKHVAYITAAFGKDVEVNERVNPEFDTYYHLMDWLAWQVQRPGEKVTWAPAIVGEQGVGKSALIEMLEALLGSRNVSKPMLDQIESRFNDWAVNCALVLLDDLLIIGRNRRTIANKLKRGVTNTTVHVERKGENGYDTPNRANYIAFTNDANFMPLEETDRRWWIFHVPSLEYVKEFTGLEPTAHFDNLYRVIKEYPNALRAFFELWNIPHSFEKMAKGVAPKTSYKRDMLDTASVDHCDGWDECKDILKEGAPGCSEDAFITPALRDAIFDRYTHLDIREQEIAKMAKIAGYKRKDTRLNLLHYGRVRVWYKGSLTEKQKSEALRQLKRGKDDE